MTNIEVTQFRTILRDNAIPRLDAGSFGVCASCKEQIHPKRFAALPWAWFCAADQEAEDRRQKTPRDEGEMSLSESE
jgi:RNA polymerase-binding transcription factor DksA